MSFKIVQQLTKVGWGDEAMLVPVDVKTIGNAPNEERKPDAEGNVPDFISIPPVIRLYIGRDVWKSPDVMPTFEEMNEMTDAQKPVVYTLTLNPRNGNFNLHAGLGKGRRLDVCSRTGDRRIEILKPESGGAESMTRKLDDLFGGQRDEATGFTLAGRIVGRMIAEMVALNEKIDEAREKRAAKEGDKPKPKRPRKPTKAEKQAAEQEARLLAWAEARKVG